MDRGRFDLTPVQTSLQPTGAQIFAKDQCGQNRDPETGHRGISKSLTGVGADTTRHVDRDRLAAPIEPPFVLAHEICMYRIDSYALLGRPDMAEAHQPGDNVVPHIPRVDRLEDSA